MTSYLNQQEDANLTLNLPAAGHRRGNEKGYGNMTKDRDLRNHHADDDYGFVVENPIEVRGIDTEYFYLDNLAFEDGTPVFYERRGSQFGPRERPIDKYNIYRSDMDRAVGARPAAVLFLYGYGKECSVTAPKGFKFSSDEYVKAVTRPDLFIPDLF